MRTTTFGPVFDDVRDRGRILTQMEVIRDVLLSAAECSRPNCAIILCACVGHGANRFVRRLADAA